jgi:hypothetical protein
MIIKLILSAATAMMTAKLRLIDSKRFHFSIEDGNWSASAYSVPKSISNRVRLLLFSQWKQTN